MRGRLALVTAGFVCLFTVSIPVRAQSTAGQGDACKAPADQWIPAARVDACTALIQAGTLTGYSLAEAHDGRAQAYMAQRDYARAIADYNEVIRLLPTNESGYYNRGTVYYAQRDDAHAIADFNEAIRLNPFFYQARNSLGGAYSRQGDHVRAIESFSRAIDVRFTDNVFAHVNRGIEYATQGNHAGAIADFTEAIRQDPGNARIYLKRAESYDRTGNAAAAAADRAEAARLAAPRP